MRHKLKARFRDYYKYEFASVLLIPFVFAFWMVLVSQRLGWFSPACCLPMVVLLLLGGFYWKAKLESLDGSKLLLNRVLDLAERFQVAIFLLTISSVCLISFEFFWRRLSVSTGDRLGGCIFVFLAVLEYVNYYHIQLQHFDHSPDLSRLLKGRGFRTSHLSADLRRRRSNAKRRGVAKK